MSIIQLTILVLAALLHNGNASERIIGGQVGTITQFPYLAQLQRRVGVTIRYTYHCTGTLVTSTRLVTAAQCFDGLYYNDPSNWKIRVGATFTEGVEPASYIFDPTAILIHDEFDSETLHNDIAVVTWLYALWPSAVVSFLPLNTDVVPDYRNVLIIGWSDNDVVDESNQIHYTNVPTVEIEACQINYAWYYRVITESMMCAGATGRGSCLGDHGLPLIYNGMLVGISSWTVGCGTANQPGVFTIVLSIDDFLTEALGL